MMSDLDHLSVKSTLHTIEYLPQRPKFHSILLFDLMPAFGFSLSCLCYNGKGEISRKKSLNFFLSFNYDLKLKKIPNIQNSTFVRTTEKKTLETFEKSQFEGGILKFLLP